MSDEQWKWIPGHVGEYEASDRGAVRSWLPYRGLPAPRVLRPALNKNGYWMVSLQTADSKRKSRYLHELVMLAFEGERPPGSQIRHLDGTRTNNHRGNLAYGTPTENAHDKKRHGTDHNVLKTHCPKGHPYADENLRVYDGRRFCRECANAHPRQRATCPQCGEGMAKGSVRGHIQRHHSGRTPGRVYVRKPIEHGTAPGYKMHLARGETIPAGDPCGCRAAQSAASAARKARLRAAATDDGTVAA